MVAPSVASDKPSAKSGRRRPLIVGLIMIAVTSGGYLVWQHFAHSPGAAVPEPPPPVPVIAATVQKQNFPIVLTGIGNVAALNSATVRSMVTEQIVSIDFKDGQNVKKGQLLAQLDPSTYQAQLDEWEATLQSDQEHLANAEVNLGRYRTLLKQNSIAALQEADQESKVSQPPGTKLPSSTPKPSSAIQNWWRRSTESPASVCSMSATSFTRAHHGGPRSSQMLWS
jgi:membrane fusion protein, multidrug efflux system